MVQTENKQDNLMEHRAQCSKQSVGRDTLPHLHSHDPEALVKLEQKDTQIHKSCFVPPSLQLSVEFILKMGKWERCFSRLFFVFG